MVCHRCSRRHARWQHDCGPFTLHYFAESVVISAQFLVFLAACVVELSGAAMYACVSSLTNCTPAWGQLAAKELGCVPRVRPSEEVVFIVTGTCLPSTNFGNKQGLTVSMTNRECNDDRWTRVFSIRV